jgi:F-type H+-transporting ATPase subunit alpha
MLWAMEMLEFPGGILAFASTLKRTIVGVAIMGDDSKIKEGDIVKRTGRIAEIPVGEAVLGRVIDAVGNPLDGKGPINAKEYRRLEMVAPGVIARKPVTEPMYTGIKAIAAMTPVGRGQRELIIGEGRWEDRHPVDAIINQKGYRYLLHYVQ